VKKKDPDYFEPAGSQIYYGYQGQGKTLSAVKHALKLKEKYPKSILVSNLDIKNVKYIRFETFEELTKLLAKSNGKYGVIYLIDEIHNYFHSHDSAKVPLWVVQVFSQQRKNRVLVIGTVQLWQDVTKVIRDQIENLIECKKIAGIIFNRLLDPRQIEIEYGQQKIKVKKTGFYIPNKTLYESYDTYQIINSGRSVFGSNEIRKIQGDR
jgi:hypothetical protein